MSNSRFVRDLFVASVSLDDVAAGWDGSDQKSDKEAITSVADVVVHIQQFSVASITNADYHKTQIVSSGDKKTSDLPFFLSLCSVSHLISGFYCATRQSTVVYSPLVFFQTYC